MSLVSWKGEDGRDVEDGDLDEEQEKEELEERAEAWKEVEDEESVLPELGPAVTVSVVRVVVMDVVVSLSTSVVQMRKLEGYSGSHGYGSPFFNKPYVQDDRHGCR